MKKYAYLRMGTGYLVNSEWYATKADAIRAFEEVARELDRYGQSIEALIHYGADIDSLAEYPDFVLSLGPRGGVRCERC